MTTIQEQLAKQIEESFQDLRFVADRLAADLAPIVTRAQEEATVAVRAERDALKRRLDEALAATGSVNGEDHRST